MMKFKVIIFSIVFLGSSLLAMQSQDTSAPTPMPKQLGWLESWLPGTFDNAGRSVEALEKISKDGVTLKHEMHVTHEMFGVNLMKTYLTAGIGGALALSGVILLFKTLMHKQTQDDQMQDLRPLYKRILTNRYLISALLMGGGVSIILKSDTIVKATS